MELLAGFDNQYLSGLAGFGFWGQLSGLGENPRCVCPGRDGFGFFKRLVVGGMVHGKAVAQITV